MKNESFIHRTESKACKENCCRRIKIAVEKMSYDGNFLPPSCLIKRAEMCTPEKDVLRVRAPDCHRACNLSRPEYVTKIQLYLRLI